MPKPNKSNCHLNFTKILKIFNMFSSNDISYIEQVLSLSKMRFLEKRPEWTYPVLAIYPRYSFLLCNINFVFKTRRFYDIPLQKMSWPWNGVKDHSRSLRVVSFDRLCMVSYLSLKCTVFWDIRLQKSRDLENRVRGPSRSLEMSTCDRAHMTFYWRSIVTMELSHVVSEIFNVEKCRDLEIGVRGHSRSLTVVPFGRSCMVSY